MRLFPKTTFDFYNLDKNLDSAGPTIKYDDF